MAASCVAVLSFLLFVSFFGGSVSWDNDDLELFDLVEEVNQNFYELMGVEQSSSSSDIRRAYRRLSLQLHPDKNKEENAEIKFRQLVAVHEVLRDPDKRDKYNSILEHGLPDWRQPVYYYRKVRKMGLLEMAALLTAIVTVGQYIVAWASYLEKKFEIEEVLSSRIKKDRKSKKAKQASNREEIHDLIEGEINALSKPRIMDLLPFRLSYLTIHTCINLPAYCRSWVLQYQQWQEEKRQRKQEEEEANQEPDEVVKKPKKKKIVDIPQYSEIVASVDRPVVYQEMVNLSGDSSEAEGAKNKKKGEWQEDEVALLIKAVARFPGGTSRRWEKIAEFVGRPVCQVVSMAKQVNASSGSHVSTSFQGTTGADMQLQVPKKGRPIREDDITERVEADRCQMDNDLRQRHKAAVNIIPVESCSTDSNKHDALHNGLATSEVRVSGSDTRDDVQAWNQNQQKILEWALAQYPRTTAERWDKIAEHIPGKTKEQCILRVKYLTELVKKKKQSQGQS